MMFKHLVKVELPKPHIEDPNDVRFLSIVEGWVKGKDYDAAMLGVPSDAGCLGRKGSSQGPKAIREAFRFLSTYSYLGADISKIKIAYLGDLDVKDADVNEVEKRLYECLMELLPKFRRLIILGGDHSITAPSTKALHDSLKEKCGMVYIDSHLDLRSGPPSSGNGIRRSIDSGSVVKVVNLGVRPYANSLAYWDLALKKGVKVITVDDIRSLGLKEASFIALQYMEDVDHIYMSLDMDVLDVAYSIGVSSPGPGGLTAEEVFELVRNIALDRRLRVTDIVEVAPNLDSNGITQVTAAYIIAHLIGCWVHK